MSIAAQKYALAETLDHIQAVFTELRQAEALEAQIHEMVVMKRHRLDALMTEYLEHAVQVAEAQATLPVSTPPSAPAPVAATPEPAAPPPLPAPAPASQPVSAAKSAVPVSPTPPEEMPLSPHGLYGAPRDLLKGQPAPSAQHVLDSLNRLMTSIKDNSAKSANAA
jgi:hypothetical protein